MRREYYVFMASYRFGTTKECYVNTVSFIRESFKHSLIITGGVQATFDGREILTSNLPYCCSNEGEDQIKYLARNVMKSYLTIRITVDPRSLPPYLHQVE